VGRQGRCGGTDEHDPRRINIRESSVSRLEGGKEGRREGGKEGRREGGKEGRREEGCDPIKWED